MLYRSLQKMDSPKTFYEFAAQCGVGESNFGKVDNTIPAAEFAFELKGDFKVFRVADMSLSDAESQLQSIDDFGHSVTIVPLDETSYEGSFGFDDYGFDLSEFAGRLMRSPEFVWRLARHVACDVYCNPDDYELTFDPEDLKDLMFHRFYYSESDEYWSVIFKTKSEQDGAG